MGSKNKLQQKVDNKVLIKYVKKASRWCRTTFENGQQKQEWFETEEEARVVPEEENNI